MSDIEKVFTSYDIQACLYDERRVEYFRRAIEATVRKGDIVVDGGSGTGLLGLLAAQRGAARVYCLEINKEYVEIIQENARRNGLADRITAIHADATTAELPEPVDVVMSEVISAGFFYEPQLQIIGNLRRFLRPGGAMIPAAMENSVELIAAQEQLYGLTFTYDTRYRSLDDVALTSAATYLATDFHQVPRDGAADIDERVDLLATRSGTANAVRVSYRIQFTEGGPWIDEPTEFLLNPQIIFLPERVPVTAGETYAVSLAYQASSSPLTCRTVVEPAPAVAGMLEAVQ